MDASTFQQPTDTQIQGFMEGDPTAIDTVVRIVLPQIYRWAVRQYSNLDPDDVHSAVNAVFAEICLKSSRYDPTRAAITTYVIHLLKLRLVDTYERQKQRRISEISFDDARENRLMAPYNSDDALRIETRLATSQFFEEMIAGLDHLDAELVALMRQGEKDTEAFASVLRRRGLSCSDKDVKNAKERLLRALRRAAREHGYELNDILES